MALIDAGIPMIDYVCASTAGCIDKQPVLGMKCDLFIDIVWRSYSLTTAFLDLNYLEECSDSPELTVAMLPRTGKVNLMSMESRLHVDMLESVASLATQGCEQIHTILDAVVRENTQQLKDSMLQWSFFLLIKQSTLNFILATSSFTQTMEESSDESLRERM